MPAGEPASIILMDHLLSGIRSAARSLLSLSLDPERRRRRKRGRRRERRDDDRVGEESCNMFLVCTYVLHENNRLAGKVLITLLAGWHIQEKFLFDYTCTDKGHF